MLKIICSVLFAVTAFQINAAQFIIHDQNDKPLVNAVVWLNPLMQSGPRQQTEQMYSMVQKKREFIPHILVVEQHALVEFPNEDSILHHVYSFSAAKPFELKLYRDKPKAPIRFDQTGVVELGCNIHDWMQAYIVVVDSPLFAISDEAGQVDITTENSQYRLNIWHKGFNHIAYTESQLVEVSGQPLIVKVNQKIIQKIKFKGDEFDEY